MPARKKPIAELRLAGTYRADRHEVANPAPEGALGAPPKHLDPEHARVWRELAKGLPDGLAGTSDRTAFELLIRLTARMRSGAMTAAEAGQLRMLLASFGLSPADRGKVTITPRQREPHPLDEFFDDRPPTGLAKFRGPPRP